MLLSQPSYKSNGGNMVCHSKPFHEDQNPAAPVGENQAFAQQFSGMYIESWVFRVVCMLMRLAAVGK